MSAEYVMPVREEEIEAPATCPMCGHKVEDVESALEVTPAEAIRRLAIMAEDDWLATRILLLHVLHPQISCARLAAKINAGPVPSHYTRDWIARKRRSMSGDPSAIGQAKFAHPALAFLLGYHKPAARAQRRRRPTSDK